MPVPYQVPDAKPMTYQGRLRTNLRKTENDSVSDWK
jgi:hypothetical protein